MPAPTSNCGRPLGSAPKSLTAVDSQPGLGGFIIDVNPSPAPMSGVTSDKLLQLPQDQFLCVTWANDISPQVAAVSEFSQQSTEQGPNQWWFLSYGHLDS